MRRRIIAIVAAFAFAFGLGAVGATVPDIVRPQQAQAAVSTRICNSSDSTDLHRIRVYPRSGAGSWYYYVGHGNCSPWLGNSNDDIRVNTCPDGNVFDYYVIKSSGSYGPHHDGCNSGSNPPDYNGSVYYKMMN